MSRLQCRSIWLSGKWLLDGIETNQDANDDFIVYPPQLIVPPGTQQVIRVTWIGEPEPPIELAYRLIAEQLPINLSQVNYTDQSSGASANVT